jgi:TPR repeat protein
VTRTALLPALVLLAMRPALADFDSGCAAFDRGDFQAARKEWQPLAEEGHAQSQFRLGCLYTFGQGVPEDHALALHLFRLAAEQGDADAPNNLGGMYAETSASPPTPSRPTCGSSWRRAPARRPRSGTAPILPRG